MYELSVEIGCWYRMLVWDVGIGYLHWMWVLGQVWVLGMGVGVRHGCGCWVLGVGVVVGCGCWV